jgi:hypothetical protein
VSRIPGP